MNLSTATTELQARGASYLSSARCVIMLNDAKNTFEDFWDWPWLEESITGNAPLTIADLKQILYVIDADQEVLLDGTTALSVVMNESLSATGVQNPRLWYLDGEDTLSVYPENTTNDLQVRYFRFSPELSGTDTPLIPTRYHNLWVDLAMVNVYEDSDDAQAAAALRADCQQRLGQLVVHYETRNRQNQPEQQITGGGDW